MRHWSSGVLIAVLVVLALASAGCGVTGKATSQGGSAITLAVSCPTDQPQCDIGKRIGSTIDLLNARIGQELGSANATIRQHDANSLDIELPGVKLNDAQQATALLGRRGEIEILDTGHIQLVDGANVRGKICSTRCSAGTYSILFRGDQIDPHAVTWQRDALGKPEVLFSFKASAKPQFAIYTRTHVGSFMTVTSDDTVIESARITSEIPGTGEITGFVDAEHARYLAAFLQLGALPLEVSVVSVRATGA